jgi:1,4-alpha-glucan branching enzyme
MVRQSSHGDTEFRFHKPGAHQVFLVGDFHDWQECRVPMDRDDAGEWVCRLQLPQGVYRFRYLADGEWHIDRDTAGLGWAPFDCNSITIMPESQTPAAFVG